MKIIESPSGIGEVRQNGERIGTVGYSLQVMQETVDGESGMIQVVGQIDSDDALPLFGRDGLRLILEDGRSIEFFVRNSSGEIRCTGPFINDVV